MDFTKPATLGRTGLSVGRLGVSGGYGAPAAAFEAAFERGCNYFYHGSSRRGGMTDAIRTIVASGKRDKLVLVAQIYTRWGWHATKSFESFLKKCRVDYADVMLLGWHNDFPSDKMLEVFSDLKERKLVKYLAVSGHHRPAFPKFAQTGKYDLFHVRYNAAHRGAEKEVFPLMPRENRPGMVIYTATSWGKLLKSGNMPKGEKTPRGSDAYRFVMSNPDVDVCMTGPKNMEQMTEALSALDRGPMNADELAWMRRVGDHIHAKSWMK